MTFLAFDHCRRKEFDFIVHNNNTLSTLKCIYLLLLLLLLLIFFLNVNSVVAKGMPRKINVTVCVNVQLHVVVVLGKCMTFVSTN